MFDPFFNENDQLEIVLGCSLKNFTKFIGHPVSRAVASKGTISGSETKIWAYKAVRERSISRSRI